MEGVAFRRDRVAIWNGLLVCPKSGCEMVVWMRAVDEPTLECGNVRRIERGVVRDGAPSHRHLEGLRMYSELVAKVAYEG
jgi:hypothetical protein